MNLSVQITLSFIIVFLAIRFLINSYLLSRNETIYDLSYKITRAFGIYSIIMIISILVAFVDLIWF